jgi:hypothetical protein
MKSYLFFIFCFTSTGLVSQILSPISINSMGRSTIVGNLMLEENLGDLQINTLSTPTFLYTQGSLQPEVGTTSTVPPINDVTLGEGACLLDALGFTVENLEDDYLLEFTLGEVVSKTQVVSTNLLTQGLLQPYNGKHWTGMVSTAWKEKNNWSPAIEPTLQDDVIIPPMCPNYPIIGSGKIGFCRDLLLMEGSSLQIKLGGTLMAEN